jgi:hypothetical protein
VPERSFLTAQWRALLMLNYAADPALLSPFVPAGTELDHHDGRTYVSLVAFRFLDTRVLGLAIPFHRDFEELNLRCYVRRAAPDGVRRGVTFLREVVPRRAIAMVARAVYNEPYVSLPMRSRVAGSPPEVCYEWRAGTRWHSLSARGRGEGAIPEPGTLEAFIAEHHWGYTRQRSGGTIEYRVEHPSWRVWPAAALRIDADFGQVYDAPLAAMLGQPASAFLADGSQVTVFRPRRIAARPAV